MIIMKKTCKSRVGFTASRVTKLALLTALSVALYLVPFLKFNLPIFPPFLDIQISDLPALMAGFMFGPLDGCLVIIIKCLLKIPLSGSMLVGELGDMLIGVAFVLSSALIYRSFKTKKNALLSLAVGVAVSTEVAIITNVFILVPFYVEAYFGGNWTPLIGMLSALYPKINADNFYFYYLLAGVLPFNILRSSISAGITFFLYKRIGKVFSLF